MDDKEWTSKWYFSTSEANAVDTQSVMDATPRPALHYLWMDARHFIAVMDYISTWVLGIGLSLEFMNCADTAMELADLDVFISM